MHVWSGAEEAEMGEGVISMKKCFVLNVCVHQLNDTRNTIIFH